MVTEMVALENLANSFLELFPNMIGALFLLVLGWLIGRVVAELLRRLLEKVKVDKHFKIKKDLKTSEITCVVLKWLIYLVFISSAIDVLGVTTLSIYFQRLVSLILGLLGGTVVILVSYLIARYLQKQVKSTKKDYSGVVSQLIFFFIMVIAISIAFDVAEIPNDLINTIIIVIVASVGLGIAIALGLGLKDTVARLAKKYEKKL